MASPVRMKGYGSKLSYASAAATLSGPATGTILSGMTKIAAPKPTGAKTQTHDLGTVGYLSTVAQIKTSQRGWIDPGELSAEWLLHPGPIPDVAQPVRRRYRVLLADHAAAGQRPGQPGVREFPGLYRRHFLGRNQYRRRQPGDGAVHHQRQRYPHLHSWCVIREYPCL